MLRSQSTDDILLARIAENNLLGLRDDLPVIYRDNHALGTCANVGNEIRLGLETAERPAAAVVKDEDWPSPVRC